MARRPSSPGRATRSGATLFERFPDDVVSDDVYVALTAAVAGRRVALADVTVTERRSPVRLPDLFRHKLRKTDAYLREIFRFLPHAGAMPAPARTIFLWRAAHLTVLPVLVALGTLGGRAGARRARRSGAPRSSRSRRARSPLVGASWWGLGAPASPILLVAHGVAPRRGDPGGARRLSILAADGGATQDRRRLAGKAR